MHDIDLSLLSKLYSENNSIRQLADIFKVSPSYIRKIMIRNHIPIRSVKDSIEKRIPIPKEEWCEVRRLYLEDGYSYQDLANKYNCRVGSIVNIFKKIKVRANNLNRFRSKKEIDMVISLYKEHKSYIKVAKILNISTCSISFVIKKHCPEIIENLGNKRTDENIKLFIEMWGKGIPNKLISQKLKIHNSMISTWVNFLKLPPRNYPRHGQRTAIIHKNKKIILRSSWELLFAQYLTNEDKDWDYEVQVFETPFGGYLPDFFIFNNSGISEIHEVKGVRGLKISSDKLNYISKLYPNIKCCLWERDDLEMVGVFNKNFKINIQLWEKSIDVKSSQRRCGHSKLYEYKGDHLSITEISEKTGIHIHNYNSRLKTGMSVYDVESIPIRKSKKVSLNIK